MTADSRRVRTGPLSLLPLLPLLLAGEAQCGDTNPKTPDCPEQLTVNVEETKRLQGTFEGTGRVVAALAAEEDYEGELLVRVTSLVGLTVPPYLVDDPGGHAWNDGDPDFSAVLWAPGEEPDSEAGGVMRNTTGKPVAAVREVTPVCRPRVESGEVNNHPFTRYPGRKLYYIVDAESVARVVTYREYLDAYYDSSPIFTKQNAVGDVTRALRVSAVEVNTVLGQPGTEVRVWVQNIRGTPGYLSKAILAAEQTSYSTSLLVGGESSILIGEDVRWRTGENVHFQTHVSSKSAATLFGGQSDLALTFTARSLADPSVATFASLRPVPAAVLSVLRDLEDYATADKPGRLSLRLNPEPTADPELPSNWCYTDGSFSGWARPAGADPGQVVLCEL